MHICVFAEGCYPYVVGGVSSWLHSLISSMPEHEFTIIALGAYEKDRGKFKYTIPNNVIEVRESFIDEITYRKGKYHRKYNTDYEDIVQFDLLFNGEDVDWERLISFINRNKKRTRRTLL